MNYKKQYVQFTYFTKINNRSIITYCIIDSCVIMVIKSAQCSPFKPTSEKSCLNSNYPSPYYYRPHHKRVRVGRRSRNMLAAAFRAKA